MEVISKRQSCRAYTGEQITKEELSVILKAANSAPVAMGKYDDVRLIVIQNSTLLSKLDTATADMIGDPSLHPIYGAPTLILVVGKNVDDSMNAAYYASTACIIENMMIAATGLGLGSVYNMAASTALNLNKELCVEAKIPEGFSPLGSVVIGKPAQPLQDRELIDTKIAVDFIL